MEEVAIGVISRRLEETMMGEAMHSLSSSKIISATSLLWLRDELKD